MIRCLIFAATNLFAAINLRAQTPPLPPGIPLTTATVSVAVSFDRSQGIFSYGYTISNSSQSIGKIFSFNLDISTGEGAGLNSTGLLNAATGYAPFMSANLPGQIQATANRLSTRLHGATIPVGFESQPIGWHSGLSMQLTALWHMGARASDQPIFPGQTLGVFALTSEGLPGIRRFELDPLYDSDDYIAGGIDDPPDGMTAQQVVDLDNAIQAAIKSQGYTVGPVQPPSLTDVGQLIQFMAGLKHQAASLRWLCGRDFVNELDEALDHAGAAYSKGRYDQARGELRRFVSQLDEGRRRHHGEGGREDGGGEANKCGDEPRVSDQAYFMLKADAEYVLAQMPRKSGGDDHDHGKSRR